MERGSREGETTLGRSQDCERYSARGRCMDRLTPIFPAKTNREEPVASAMSLTKSAIERLLLIAYVQIR